MTFSATEAAFEGFRVVRRQPLAIVFWALVYLALFVAIFALFGGSLATFMATAESLETAQPSPQELQAVSQDMMGFFALLWPLVIVISAVLSAAVARSVLYPEQKTFGYLRLGIDELRVLAVSLIIAVVTGALAFVMAMLVGALASLAGAANLGLGILVGLILGVGAFAVFVWVAVRLSLAIPLTLAEKRIAPFASFAMTKGRVMPLLGVAIIAFVMSLLVSVLGTVIAMPITVATGGGLEQLAKLDGQTTLQIIQTAGGGLAAWAVVNALFSALQLPVTYAPFAAAYRDLKGLPHA